MPRPAITDEQRRNTRRTIRKAAAELYAEKGLGEISARAIADKAGVSVGTLYAYFDNLTELMQSLWKAPVAKLIGDLEQALDALDDPLVQLRTLLQAYADFATEYRSVYRGAFLYVRPESHEKPTPVSPEEDRFFSLFRNTVSAAQQQKLIRSGDPDVIAQVLWSGLHGSIALPLNLDRLALEPPENATRHMIDALLEWLKP